MALKIVEFFGYDPRDQSLAARTARETFPCPFKGGKCTKTLSRDGTVSGVCTVRQSMPDPIIICPNRLYAGKYQVLVDVASAAFGEGVRLIAGDQIRSVEHDGRNVVAFGKGWGKELKLPQVKGPDGKGRGGYFVDWVLALIGTNGHLQEFVAVEVQSMDTTGNYREQRAAYLREEDFPGYSTAGINWENVSKRILPQIIYKGHVLRRERLCKGGLFFVCPAPVYKRIWQRLGADPSEYPVLQPGAITFRWYDIGPPVPEGQLRSLDAQGQFTTTTDQVALAFTAPKNLPPSGVYEEAIERELR
jgi:Restriction endonuclease NotI